MANRIEIMFKDGGMMIFDHDPHTTVDWIDDRVMVRTGEGDCHWFTDISDVWQGGVPVTRSISMQLSPIDVTNFNRMFYGGGRVTGGFSYASP